MANQDNKTKLIQALIDSGLLKFGEFTLKSGKKSDHYIDLRCCVMYRDLIDPIKVLVGKILSTIDLNGKALVPMPYGAYILGGMIADCQNLVCRPVRKETKGYGDESNIYEGPNFKYIILEDVMSTGSSIVDTIKKLGAENISTVITVVDRELGGEQHLKALFPHIELHSVLKSSEILDYHNKLSK